VIDTFPEAFNQVVENDDLLKIVGEPFKTVDSYAIAVCNIGDELANALNEALDEVMSDGTYDELYYKWFTPKK